MLSMVLVGDLGSHWGPPGAFDGSQTTNGFRTRPFGATTDSAVPRSGGDDMVSDFREKTKFPKNQISKIYKY